jgi:3-oxoadipate enol-lactonase
MRRVFIVLAAVLTLASTGSAQSIRTGKTRSGLAYDVRGSGPVIVLITGANLDRRMWDREAEWLSTNHTVVRYDLRAHGDSDTATAPFNHLGDLISLLDELKIDRATLIGLSAGSTIAIDAALEIPDRIDRIIVAGPAPSGYVPKQALPFAVDMMAALKAGDYKKVSEILLATSVFAAPPETRGLVRDMVIRNDRMWTIDRSLMKAQAQPAMGRLESIKAPTLILIGEKDEFQREPAELLAARIPGARIVRIAGGGHLLNLTSPEEFDAAVAAFLVEGRIAAFEALTAQRRSAAGADRSRLELRWLRALSDVVSAMSFRAGRDHPWAKSQEDLLYYDEIGGQWRISTDLLDKSYAAHSTSVVADDIAWLAATNGLGGECEGYIPCYASTLNELYGKYLRRQPRGTHRQEALDVIADALQSATRLLNDPHAEDFLDVPHDCPDLMVSARPLRAAMAGAEGAKSNAVMLIDRLIAKCPKQ